MREIKFRAWEVNENRMVAPDELVFWNGCCYLNPSKSLRDPNKPYSAARLKGYTILEKYVMQYTGLKDKNGIEIYEGDIVRYNTGETWVVKWVSRYAGFTYVSNKKGENLGQIPGSHEVEVIGNIYENPNLLQKGNEDGE